jgi:hypothetical protein
MNYYLVNFPEGDSPESPLILLFAYGPAFVKHVQKVVKGLAALKGSDSIIMRLGERAIKGLELELVELDEEADHLQDPFDEAEENCDGLVLRLDGEAQASLCTPDRYTDAELNHMELQRGGLIITVRDGKDGEYTYETGFLTYESLGIAATA